MKSTILILVVNTCLGLGLYAQTPANIYTPACTLLYNTYYTPELSSSEINYLNQQYQSAYPNAIYISSSSGKYNCHGYAWYVTEGGAKVWIGAYAGSDPEEEFMNDGSYVEVPTEVGAQKVSYRSSDHSAITTSTSGWVQSKWAYGPVMKHKPSDCPFTYSSLKYYTSVKNMTGTINSGTYTMYGQIKASGQLASSSNVNFRAGKSIKLNPGFKVVGATFQANMISSCWPSPVVIYSIDNDVSIDLKSTDYSSQQEELTNNIKPISDKLVLFPNPVSELLYVNGVSSFEYTIYDCYGKLLLSSKNSENSIDVSSLNSGVYVIQIVSEGTTHIDKFVKQ